MSQVTLDDSDVGSFVDQSVTATVPQHMRVNLQMLQAGLSGDLPNHQPHRGSRQRFAPLTDEQRVAILRRIHPRSFGQPSFNGWRLAVVELVRTAIATFEASYVKFFRVHVDVAKLDRAKLADPQAVPEHQK